MKEGTVNTASSSSWRMPTASSSSPRKPVQKPAKQPLDLRKVICEHCGAETGEVGVDPIGTCKGCQAIIDAGMSPQSVPSPVAEARGEGAGGGSSAARARRRRLGLEVTPDPDELPYDDVEEEVDDEEDEDDDE